jgi:hypothetical protein
MSTVDGKAVIEMTVAISCQFLPIGIVDRLPPALSTICDSLAAGLLLF